MNNMEVQVLLQMEKFMDKFRIPKGSSSVSTHTSMGPIFKKRGNFHVPDTEIDSFFEEYTKVVFTHKKPLYLTERPIQGADSGMLKFDLDFKYQCESLDRLYDDSVVKMIVDIIQKILSKYIVKKNENTFHAFVFQRKTPYRKDNFVKDGIHIMYPFLYVMYPFHYYTRTLLIDALEKSNLNDYVPFTNSIQDVVDESIIENTGWLMYGSTKENVSPYKLTVIYDENMNIVENTYTEPILYKLLSIRNKCEINEFINKDWMATVTYEKKKTKVATNVSIQNVIEKSEILSLEQDNSKIPDKSHIEKLVGIICPKKCFDYQKWTEIGLCLHNIHPNLFDVWIMYSKQDFSNVTKRIQKQLETETDDVIYNTLENDMEDWNAINEKKSESIKNEINQRYILDERWMKGCLDKWESFKRKSEGGLNIGSLIYWAKKDNPELFKRIRSHPIRDLIIESVHNPSHCKIAAVLYHKYRHQYICSGYNKNIWYEWDNHCWKVMDGVVTIRRKITGSMNDKDCLLHDYKEIREQIRIEKIEKDEELKMLNDELRKCEEEFENEKQKVARTITESRSVSRVKDGDLKAYSVEKKQKEKEIKEKRKELLNMHIKPFDDTITRFLETSSSIDNIVKEAKTQFYEKEFNKKNNANTNLFLFNNGVFDLECMSFRDGRPDDFISIDDDRTQINYKDYGMNSPEIKIIEDYFEKVIVDKEKREFFLTLIASCIEGGNNNSIFAILTGNGSNAKSLTMDFIENCFVKYSGKLNPAFLTQKRNKSSSASPEYHGIVDCRIVSSEETDSADELNTAIIKEITGNTKVTSRTLFQEKMTTKTPQFTPFLICNDLPQVKSLDGGTWRRIVVISFDSKFVDNPSDEKWQHLENVFPINRNLKKDMESWKEPFMYLLLHKYYKKFKENEKNLNPPSCVKAFTEKFREENDVIQPFIDTNILITGSKSDCIKIKELHKRIVDWFRENHTGEKEPDQKYIKKYFESRFGSYDSKGWVGKKLIEL